MQRAVLRDSRLADCPLALHMGLGSGALTTAHLGGVWGRYVFVLDGPAMHKRGADASSARVGK